MNKNVIRHLITFMLMTFALAACGSSGVAGKYVPVAGDMGGVAVSGEELYGFQIELENDGTGIMTVLGKTSPAKWTSDGTNMTIDIDGEKMVAGIGQDSLTFDDMYGMGMKVIFAKEGSDAANPELYLPENDKYLVGAWNSTEVKDIDGKDIDPSEMKPDALSMTLRSDYTADVSLAGKSYDNVKWSNYLDIGYIDSEDDIKLYQTEGGIKVDYTNAKGQYIFFCPKNTK